jgi:hypothetical protein
MSIAVRFATKETRHGVRSVVESAQGLASEAIELSCFFTFIIFLLLRNNSIYVIHNKFISNFCKEIRIE